MIHNTKSKSFLKPKRRSNSTSDGSFALYYINPNLGRFCIEKRILYPNSK